MNVIKRIPTLWWVSFFFGLFFVSCAFAFKAWRVEGQKVKRLSAIHQELQSRSRFVLDNLNNLDLELENTIVPPEDLFVEPNVKLSIPEVSDLPEGYRLHKITLSLSDVSPEALSELMNRGENASPPWRVTRADLKTDVQGLQGELIMEALDKSPPEL